MVTFSDYRRIQSVRTLPQKRRQDAHDIFNQTFDEDMAYRLCYIYDYAHDDAPDKAVGMEYGRTTKTPIDTKYLVTQYGSLSKDQVEYHLVFRYGQKPVPYYVDSFGRNAEFPIGMYIDIPDENDVYRKWMICSRDREPDFIKYSVLPCNYYLHWVTHDGKLRKMWSIARLRNSYNSGIWNDYRMTTVENQDQVWLPRNAISNQLFYDDRFVISDMIPEPIVWKISKVENIHPFGINKLTLAQDMFNKDTDYVNWETGEMYADYYKRPLESPVHDFYLEYEGDKVIKVRGLKRIIRVHHLPDVDIHDLEWKMEIDGHPADEIVDLEYVDDKTVSIYFKGGNEFLGSILCITAKAGKKESKLEVKVVAL